MLKRLRPSAYRLRDVPDAVPFERREHGDSTVALADAVIRAQRQPRRRSSTLVLEKFTSLLDDLITVKMQVKCGKSRKTDNRSPRTWLNRPTVNLSIESERG